MDERRKVTLVAISQIKYPTDSRRYLLDLFKDVVIENDAKFVIVAGNTVDGKALEKVLKAELKQVRSKLNRAKRKEFNVEEYIDQFAESHAHDLGELLPKIEGVNYHIVIAQRVYDRDIGTRILEHLRDQRPDVRLIGDKGNGEYDPEVKIPVRMRGLEEIRVIVPRRAPWFYRIITSFMQRLINSFVSRTFSPPPGLILVGCTGTGAYLPFHESVPSFSVPALHKIDEQLSTENMVGCLVVKLVNEKRRVRITGRTYDFRPIVAQERALAIPPDASEDEKRVLSILKTTPASPNTILFKINTKGKPELTGEQLEPILRKLKKQGTLVYRQRSNHWAINEMLLREAKVTLEKVQKNTHTFTLAVFSCYHGGALKTLYHTSLRYLPKRIWRADGLVENGDGIQGIAHNYEYSGELLPIANGDDKQEILVAHLRARTLLDIFRLRLHDLGETKLPPEETLRRCLIPYVYNIGNHPAWKYYNKGAIPLALFEERLKSLLVRGLANLCEETGIAVSFEQIERVVEERVIRVGESQLVNLNGTVIGIRHPFKGRTQSKSHRIQDATDFVWRSFQSFSDEIAKQTKGFALVLVANFHEAAAVHVVKFGTTIFGVMTGAYLKDTQFETTKDKVVDHGHALVTVCLNQEDRLVFSEVEFDNFIHPADERIILTDKVTTSAVNKLCAELTKIVDLPWR